MRLLSDGVRGKLKLVGNILFGRAESTSVPERQILKELEKTKWKIFESQKGIDNFAPPEIGIAEGSKRKCMFDRKSISIKIIKEGEEEMLKLLGIKELRDPYSFSGAFEQAECTNTYLKKFIEDMDVFINKLHEIADYYRQLSGEELKKRLTEMIDKNDRIFAEINNFLSKVESNQGLPTEIRKFAKADRYRGTNTILFHNLEDIYYQNTSVKSPFVNRTHKDMKGGLISKSESSQLLKSQNEFHKLVIDSGLFGKSGDTLPHVLLSSHNFGYFPKEGIIKCLDAGDVVSLSQNEWEKIEKFMILLNKKENSVRTKTANLKEENQKQLKAVS